ncbi:CRISPR-associated helicase/endonuclease Cas3 [Candidatus Nitrospira nitrificans]|uniref:CRISPR-associated helicase, Cas3 family n=1 Tax=Candidatus Nitrospira nitrificans TaxID=1742973 RepID=A0A0S4L8G9_9BACT|nr:CRISPR-associated helicase/endonuclease Cas3 [Candidatus Nitrospira nitrificans]CUS33066.1 CRISPR-associated helicase, Cas3 family [Candidatus Nitrospira nitrificans]
MNKELPAYIAHVRKTGGDPQSLEEHLLGVAEIAKGLASKIHLEHQGELIGLLHDLGKYSNEFQAYLKSAVGLINQDEAEFVDARGLKRKVDHSTAGAQLVWEELSQQGDMGRIAGQFLALCIASHHSGLINCLSSDTNSCVEDIFTRRIGKRDDRSHFREAMSKVDTLIYNRFRELVSSPGLINGLKESIRQVILRDHIKGLDPSKNQITQFKLGLLVRFLFSCLIDADRADTADFERPKAAKYRLNGQYTEWPLLIERLEKHLQGFTVRNPIDEFRQNISDHCLNSALRDKGIYTLTVPTGGGKTLASLRFALHHAERHKMDRAIYVIPFTSIIDQNAKVVRDILEPTKDDRGRVVLEHHSNLTPEQQGWREKILTENWDAPIVFTTSVQLLETIFGGGTRGARRMHQLANAVLIFDEIQTLPVNCVHLFSNAMNFLVEHCGSTVVLCTATQPLLNRVDQSKGALKFTKNDDLMPDVKGLFDDLKRVEVLNRRKPGGWTDEEIARLALDEVAQSKSCLVIVNTKKSAQTLFRLCREAVGIQTFHLSTNMCPAHRKEVLDQIRQLLDDESPVLCISTQLIEAGVDVDFGAVIRYTAGLDSIAQAAGRCNRNGKQKDADGNPKVGRVHVVNPAVENIDRLKDIQCGKGITERLLDDVEAGSEDFGGNLIGPKAIERYFEYFFFNRHLEMDYPVSAQSVGRDDTLLNLLSTNSLAMDEYGRNYGIAPNIYLRQSFMSAAHAFKVIDAPTRGIIVPYGKAGRDVVNNLCSAFEVEKQFVLLRRAQQYTVNVFPQDLEKLQKAGAVSAIQKDVDILHLSDARYYNQSFGLSQTPEGTMEVLYA